MSIVEDSFKNGELGVLSVDVDGNDYWFLERLMHLAPSIVVVEYNASFGLRPITVPYDEAFDRSRKHPSDWYHGASITALTKLAAKHDYSLVAVAESGANLFFVRNAVRHNDSMPTLAPEESYRENVLRNKWSNTDASTQWDVIKRLPYVAIE